jgi:hypothetical protein
MSWRAVAIGLSVCVAPLSAMQKNDSPVRLEAGDVPRIVNGTLNQRAVTGSLASTMTEIARSAADTPVWAGYAISAVKSSYDSGCSAQEYRLEDRGDRFVNVNDNSTARPALDLFILVRFERGQATRMRFLSSGCIIDATGTSVQWLTPVPSADSVAYLRSLASNNLRSLSSGAIAAISLHADPAADRALISMAHDDPSPNVRGDALFWMAQKAGSKVAAEIAGSIENDPDTQVKKRAVFALAQISNGDGIPKLIEVARTNRNPAIRKEAAFWLGQSRDTRALQFIEDVLTR